MPGGITGQIRTGLVAALIVLVASTAISFSLFAFGVDVDEVKREIIKIQEEKAREKEKAEAEAEVPGEASSEEGATEFPEGAWRLFESDEGGFEILFPGMPAFKQSIRDTAFGDIVENHYEIVDETGDFSAEYNELPFAIVLLASDRMIYKRVRNALLEEVGGKERSFEKIKQGALKGRELIFETEESYGRARFFIKKKRLYVLFSTIPKDGGDEAKMLKFLDSFEPFGKARGRKPHKYIEMQKPEPKEEKEPEATPLPSQEESSEATPLPSAE